MRREKNIVSSQMPFTEIAAMRILVCLEQDFSARACRVERGSFANIAMFCVRSTTISINHTYLDGKQPYARNTIAKAQTIPQMPPLLFAFACSSVTPDSPPNT